MSNSDQVSRNEQFINIKSLSDFEAKKLQPFINELDKLLLSVNDLTAAISHKRSVINARIEEESAKEYEQALIDMAKESAQELETEASITPENDLAPISDTIDEGIDDIPESDIYEDVSIVPSVEETDRITEEEIKVESATDATVPHVIKEIIPESEPRKKIHEFAPISRPKTEKEKASEKGRVFIPDSSKKPSGQPISKTSDNLPRSRRPQEGEVRGRPQSSFARPDRPFGDRNNQQFNPARQGSTYKPLPGKSAPFKPLGINKPISDVGSFAPKDNRTTVKKKTDSKVEEKKTMDKRTLLRRGFIDNKAPGAALDFEAGDDRHMKAKRGKKGVAIPLVQIEKAVITSEMVPIKVLSEKIGKSGAQIIKQLFLLGIVKTINEAVNFETAELVASELGVELVLNVAKSSEEKLQEQYVKKDESGDLKLRPAVVTIMGHVDHGKTSVLDYIRKSKVAASEAGGITQHIGAYTVEIKGEKITFLDTPGHEAFTSMRLRGAQVTDIVIIVVAADDGIMPQTVEAISHAKAAGVSIIVAINKMDKKTANPDRIKQQLTEHGLVPEEWGGDTICVPVSAVTGDGIDKLLEAILLVAEIKELKAYYDNMARGVIIEAQLDKGKGPVATVLVQNGNLRVSDYIVAGTVTGKIRAMVDDKGNMIKSAGPSQPVQIQGFDEVPQAGDVLMAVSDEKLAKKVVEDRREIIKSAMTMNKAGTSLEDMFQKIAEGDIKDLNIIIKADVQGSVEAIKQELLKLSNDEVRVNVVQGNVGAITESDVMLAESSGSIIIGFNVRPESKAKKMAERSNIDIRVYRIIYDIINDITLALKGMLQPKLKERIIGRAEVRMTFKITGAGTIAGCYVIEDKIIRNAKVRLLRSNVIVYEGEISSLKRVKEDTKEVAQGYECGIGIAGYNDIKEGDIIEAYVIEEIKS